MKGGKGERGRTPLLADVCASQTEPQQTGVLFIMRQQVQPHFMQAEMQSQQDWIISQHF